MADASIGRPRQKRALAADERVTPEGLTPPVTAGQLQALRERLGSRNQTEFAEALGVSQALISSLLGGTRPLQGPLHLLVVEKLRRYRID
jgi:predicted transcriptional regulator